MELEYPNFKGQGANNQSLIAKELNFEARINEIFGKISIPNQKDINVINYENTSVTTAIIPTIAKKIIFQQNDLNESGQSLEVTGANGEEEVLIYYINEFIKLQNNERIIGVNDVYQVIIVKTGNESLLKYRDKCLAIIQNDEELKKALIPFFYITMHYKYSYFDIIAYKDKKPVIVEVKTTTSLNNHRFILSTAEVNAARTNKNYEIVRVAPDCIRFLGNPIQSMEDKIEFLKSDTFSLIPRNYEFKFNENDK